MIWIEDLFKKDNVPCPEWLLSLPLDDQWRDAEYSFEGNVHMDMYKFLWTHKYHDF